MQDPDPALTPHRAATIGTDGATAIIRTLHAAGIDAIFTSPGSEWAPLWEALARERAAGMPVPAYHSVRHEEVAVPMAAGYAKATGRIPAVVLHATVGTLHASMALRGALHERVPMVVIAGAAMGYGEMPGPDPGGQWLNHLIDAGGPAALAERTVRWTADVPTGAILPSTIARAVALAGGPIGGPAFVDVAMEVLFETMTHDPPRPLVHPHPVPDPGGLDLLAARLSRAAAPVIVTDEIGRDPGDVARLVRLAEVLGAPVVETRSARYLNFPRRHPLYGGIDTGDALADADVIVLLAIRAPWHPASRPPGRASFIAAVDADPLRMDLPFYGYDLDLAVTGAPDAALVGLTERLAGGRDDPAREARRVEAARHAEARRHDDSERAGAKRDDQPIDIDRASRVISESLPDGAIVVEETFTARASIHSSFDRLGPGTFFSGAMGGLGTGLGTAIGVKCAHPDRTVVCLIGDGSFHYDPVLAAFGAMQESGLPILVVIYDNAGYGSQERTIPRYFPDGLARLDPAAVGMSIEPIPDYPAIARAFGGWGTVVTTPRELGPAIEEAVRQMAAGHLALVDLRLAPVAAAVGHDVSRSRRSQGPSGSA
jgi:thiamine pyrophosphate-dependent acetolactate synthase large subunit-like protein